MLFLFENFALDCGRRELRLAGTIVPVEPQVFDILVYLIANRDRVVSKDDLIASVWGGRIVSESTLTSRINAVRRAVGDSGHKQEFVRTFARKGVRWIAPVKPGKPEAEAEGQINNPLALPQKPSIAVLPFRNMSGDPDHDSFVDGVTEEIITALSRVRWFFVIARGSAFAYKSRDIDPNEIARELGVRYILTGSVRRADDRIRVAAQLIDANSRSNVWARSYDRALSDIFAVQDEITQTIVGGIEPELGRAERERARIKQRDSIDAWSIYQRGMFHVYRYTQADLAQARKLFEDAIAIDADLGPAYSAIAEAYYYEVVYGFADSPGDNRQRAIEVAQKAVALDRDDAGAHCTLGRIRYLCREYAERFPNLNLHWISIRVWRLRITASEPHSSSPEDRMTHSLTWNRPFGSVPRIRTWVRISCASRKRNILLAMMRRLCVSLCARWHSPAFNGPGMRSSSLHWANWDDRKRHVATSRN